MNRPRRSRRTLAPSCAGHEGRLEWLEPRTLLAAYVVADLGTLGGPSTFAASLNDAGQVTGKSDLPEDSAGVSATHAFRWQNGHMTDLGDLGDGTLDSEGLSINASGQILGYAEGDGDLTRSRGFPALFNGSQIQALDDLLPDDSPWAFDSVSAINDDGVVLGWVLPADTFPEGFIHLALFDTTTGQLTDLGRQGAPSADFGAINNVGQAVFTRDEDFFAHEAFLVSGGTVTNLGSLGGDDTTASDINDAGDVVGSSETAPNAFGERFTHAFLRRGGTMTDLGAAPGFDSSDAAAINAAGDIVGTVNSTATAVDAHPFLYRDGKFELLNNLIPGDSPFTLTDAVDINDAGQILASARTADGSLRAVLLTPDTTAPGRDDVRPTATLVDAPDVTTGGGTTYTFRVHFDDDTSINAATVRADSVYLEDNIGTHVPDLVLVSTTPDADGHGLTATYRFGARGGVWNPADNGRYDVVLDRDTVADAAGNHVVPGPLALGHVRINLPSSTKDFAGAADSDMAVAPDGALHLAFFDATDERLRYATRSPGGAWSTTSVIDPAAGVGRFVSLALDAAGRPGVAYYDSANADLKYAHFDGAAWDVETVDSLHSTGGYPSLAYDAAGRPAIAYWRKTGGDLLLARSDGTEWNDTALDTEGNTGRFPSLELNPATDRLALAWEDHDGGRFKYASENPDGTFATTVVDDTTPRGGGYVSLAFDPANKFPAFSYYDAANADLKFARFDGTTWGLASTGQRGTIGLYSRLFFDDEGIGNIYAYDRGSNALVRATTSAFSSGIFARNVAVPGGRRLAALATGGAGDVTLAFLDADASHLHVQEYNEL